MQCDQIVSFELTMSYHAQNIILNTGIIQFYFLNKKFILQ
jgi:hypothetical protein